jgi:tetratricopeptide (TPR) repeat protein
VSLAGRLLPALLLALGGWAALGGCAALAPERVPLARTPVELTQTAFHPQQAYQCGPAALATVLEASGVAVAPEALAPAVYLPGRRGSLQVELLAAVRRHQRLAVTLAPTPAAVVAQLQAGRPVLVLQNLASSLVPVWHYAVVVGYRPEQDQFVLRSGRDRRRLVSRGRFEATWRRADHWAVVVLDPATPATGLEPDAYLQAAADLESTGAHQAALRAFRSAAAAWPERAMPLLGQANNLYHLGRLDQAEAVYRRLVTRHPEQPVAVHNLAMLLVERGRACEATAVVGVGTPADHELVRAARRAVAEACPAPGSKAPDLLGSGATGQRG